MSDNWKILRGDKELPPEEAPSAASDARDNVATDRYGDPVNDSPGDSPGDSSGASPAQKSADRPAEAVSTTEQPIPKKHFTIGLCILVLVFFFWIFRQEVRGVFFWAVAKAQGHDVPLSAKAPGLSGVFRFGKEYTLKEFFAACAEGTVASVTKILEKQPDLLEPKDGTTILHMVAARPINPEIFGLILKRVGGDGVNARDSQGRTPLHIAAASPAPIGFILALRANGANVIVHDNEGKTPVDAFFDSPFSKPTKITKEESALFSEYGHIIAIFGWDRNGDSKTKFVPLAEQLPEVEGKRYFTQLAQAQSVGRDAGVSSGLFARGDVPRSEHREMSASEIEMVKIRGNYREPAQALWRSVKVAPDTGTALARLKCLLPMAYPSSLNFFSSRMAGDLRPPVFITEWNAWDVPAEARVAIMMEALRKRAQKARPQMTNPKPGVFTFSGGMNYGVVSTRIIRERGAEAAARNPLVMTWMLLEYGPAMKAAEKPALLTGIDVTMLKESGGGKDPDAGKELANVRALHGVLPESVWRKVGMHLVAAAYVADKRRDAQWGAGFMPGYYKDNGGLSALRLWACEGRKDQSEPLRRVLAETGNVSPELAKAMVALVLRSGPQSTARDESGKSPVEYAKQMGVSSAVMALVAKMPVYEPPEKLPAKPPKDPSREFTRIPPGSEGRDPKAETRKDSGPAPSRTRMPLGTVKNSTI